MVNVIKMLLKYQHLYKEEDYKVEEEVIKIIMEELNK